MKPILALLLLLTASAFSQIRRQAPAKPQPPPTPKAAATLPAPAMTAADLEAFLDGVVPLEISRADIAGAVVAVVKDGNVLLEKGYGYADVKSKKKVSPTDTLFRPGSISKLFTWTAVMQMVEQGKLDLDKDVSGYLDFPVPQAFGKPITLRHIMTHTAGFEEAIKDLFVAKPEDLQPLNVYLETHMPRRMYPPGTTPAYSNYATALAGYMVQRVSGEPLEQYISAHILQPLGMDHASFQQPLPPALLPLMSSGYTNASTPAKPFEVVNAWPAGSLSASADAMTRLMIAHLQDGEYKGVRILKAETARMMHASQPLIAEGMNTMALGFYEESRNGHRIIGHAGDTQAFHSDLHLVPDLGLGFFVSYNSAGRNQLNNRGELWHVVLDRYYPYQPETKQPPATAAADATAVSGTYLNTRGSLQSVIRVAGILGETKVAPAPGADGVITVSALKGMNGQVIKWHEIGPLLYQEEDGQGRIAFRKDPSGNLELVTDFPVFIFQRVGTMQNQITIYALMIFSLGMFLLTLLGWPIAAVIRRHYRATLDFSYADRRWHKMARLVCLANLAVVGLWAAALTAGSGNIGSLSHLYDMRLYLLQAFGLLSSIAGLLALYNALRAWLDPTRWLGSRIWESLIALACLCFAWLGATLNLIVPNARY